MSEEGKYKVAGIGIGRAGTGRVRAYDANPLCEVVAVADSDQYNLDLAAERFGVPGYATAEELFANHEIAIAVASLPVRANHSVVMAAVEGNVKVMVTEKPFTAKLSDADEMVEACRAKGIEIASGLVSWNRLNHWAAREILWDGVIGDVQRINMYDANGQGGCHGINLARHFANDADVEFVTGFVERDPFSDYESQHTGSDDMGFGGIGGYIRFANGVEAFSSFKPVNWRGFEVIGSDGILYKKNGTSLKLDILKAVGDELQPVDVSDVAPPVRNAADGSTLYDDEGWAELTDGMWRSTAAVVESLETGESVQLTTGDDLRKALEIAIAMRESARRGGEPVKLPLEDRSLTMYPQNSRWNYKKEFMGQDAYAEALSNLKKE
jgi:predicted dehydrogenase